MPNDDLKDMNKGDLEKRKLLSEIEKNETESAKNRAEEEKSRREAAVFRRQSETKWWEGKALAKVSGTILTAIAIGAAIYTYGIRPLSNKQAELVKIESFIAAARADSFKIEKARVQRCPSTACGPAS